MSCDPYSRTAEGLRLRVRLAPKSSADRILGLACEADGGTALKIAVTAPPEDGKANARLLALLAKRLGIGKTDIAIVQGATARHKTLLIKGDADRLARLVAATLETP